MQITAIKAKERDIFKMSLNQRISPNLSETSGKQQVQACRQGGFTLIELLVVIAILGILMAISSGAWSSYREATRVDSAKEKVVSVLQQTRLKALSSGFPETIQFDWVNNTITVGARVITMDAGVDLKGYTCDTATAYNAGVSTFTFNPGGSFGSAYSIGLDNPPNVQVSSPSTNKVFYIKTNGITGRVVAGTTC